MILFFCYNRGMKTIIFDFNGTIVDDVDIGIKALNVMIDKYLDRSHITKAEYLHIFTFPVIDYYKKVGFDFDKLSFEKVGAEWMEVYEANFKDCKLHQGVREMLLENKRNGIRNVLLSASRKDKLLAQCEILKIRELFAEILGINDIYASSKVNIAKDWMRKQSSGEYLFIGDTLHDLEAAKEIGTPCALVANGHQAKDVLLKVTDRVYDDIREVKDDPDWPK